MKIKESTIEQFARDFIWECKNEDTEYAADYVIGELEAEGDLEGVDTRTIERLRSLLVTSAMKSN